MAPKRGMSVEKTEEHEAFMKKLAEYHEKRGTTFEPEPKVGIRHIDLYKLYNRIVEEGGYDLVSDTKARPLMWRKFAEEFVGKNQYTAAQAFQIKNVYYKNLCAYEISTHWGKEPPPKEILEDVTAKGANVMGRTLENYTKPPTKEELNLANGDTSDVSPEQKTPKAEAVDGAEDPGSATGRTTRGLRQAPPQRVLFQPDLTASRQTRGVNQPSNSPAIGGIGMMNAASLTNGASATLANYEPSQSYPLSLKPVITPANNPEHYRNVRKRKAEANAGPLARKYRNIMLPGTGFIGPNIYVRAQMALMSGIPEEEQYALHHLVKISHERGDKYRFDQFPGLAEALVKKVLQVSGLFYDVDWDVSYDEDTMYLDDETLDGLSGTSDVIRKLKSRIPLPTDDSMQDAQFVSQLNRMTEAALVVRNMCLQGENAQYLVKQPLSRDYLAVVLNLPQHPGVIELQHYALETAEQLLVWCDLAPQDALYQSLLAQLYGKDRGLIITSLKTISRIAMNLSGPKRLDEVPRELLQRIQQWLLVEDEELRSACLDFLFQYTSFADNVDNLLQNIDAEALSRQLSRLLLFAAKEHKEQRPPTRQPEDDKTPVAVPRLSRSLVESLLKLDEPDRSSEWLRMCFLPDKESEMTQISLWQAYQGTFASYHATHPHLIAGDFIKNVSTTFAGATAQVAGANKYVIRGIRARKVPVDTGLVPGSKGTDKGKELHKCSWRITVPADTVRDPITGVQSGPTTKEVDCGEWFKQADDMLKHILREHLQVPAAKKPSPMAAVDGEKMDIDSKPSRPSSAMANGHTPASSTGTTNLGDLFDFQIAEKTTYRCRWASCRRNSPEFATQNGKVPRTTLFARHIQTHLPESDATRLQHNLKPDADRTPANSERITLKTLEDEKGDAAGVSLSAALVLRNIAKFMPKTLDSAQAGVVVPGRLGTVAVNGAKDGGTGGEELMKRIFDEEVKDRLFYALTHSKPIHSYVGSVLRAIGGGGA
ncbi:hypothetical protein LTR85_001136 [Meristemomyces frigidus]|nr:hypothetical protein LTR85_001136 [Meristemomyces frigidus]